MLSEQFYALSISLPPVSLSLSFSATRSKPFRCKSSHKRSSSAGEKSLPPDEHNTNERAHRNDRNCLFPLLAGWFICTGRLKPTTGQPKRISCFQPFDIFAALLEPRPRTERKPDTSSPAKVCAKIDTSSRVWVRVWVFNPDRMFYRSGVTAFASLFAESRMNSWSSRWICHIALVVVVILCQNHRCISAARRGVRSQKRLVCVCVWVLSWGAFSGPGPLSPVCVLRKLGALPETATKKRNSSCAASEK